MSWSTPPVTAVSAVSEAKAELQPKKKAPGTRGQKKNRGRPQGNDRFVVAVPVRQ
eukprot:NODE_22963_length_687_cov_2.414286.p5 GENE.NODE_22963_length_687_cov_2.414286~~NODE_22963_length_687_cov_2.414286.p5  ORF type:complete len:55 (-),score=8.82 NODE_22963_length_687_cov_2.414286:252-416(-)